MAGQLGICWITAKMAVDTCLLILSHTNAKEAADAVVRHAEGCRQWACDRFEEVLENQLGMVQKCYLSATSHSVLSWILTRVCDRTFQHRLVILFGIRSDDGRPLFLSFHYSTSLTLHLAFNRCVPHLITTARSRCATLLLSERKELREWRHHPFRMNCPFTLNYAWFRSIPKNGSNTGTETS
ncbi:hypothetical protein BDN72DRAFT_423515 [Pluteus cervinus]|uniref:Uncharacterized protein n=1 Tax=Pluteus cervinus TaxID=181527 RepID=A0ACD3A873_9AGAR|nr:hypothetical protein BDN72DRAFT_423515 [Pluteus cervinus]